MTTGCEDVFIKMYLLEKYGSCRDQGMFQGRNADMGVLVI